MSYGRFLTAALVVSMCSISTCYAKVFYQGSPTTAVEHSNAVKLSDKATTFQKGDVIHIIENDKVVRTVPYDQASNLKVGNVFKGARVGNVVELYTTRYAAAAVTTAAAGSVVPAVTVGALVAGGVAIGLATTHSSNNNNGTTGTN